jgi:hypothetical protein
MAAETPPSTGFSLRRWSQRKHAAARGEPELQRSDPVVERAAKTSDASRTPVAAPANPATAAPAATAAVNAATDTAIPLPSLESLTIESDFSPFMQPGVDEELKRTALRKLLRHPRFNVMDGLDVYIDDYSKPSPLEPELVRTLAQARYIFDPPKTRVSAEGIVEDVPDEAPAASDEAGVGGALDAPTVADANAVDANVPSRVENDLDVPPPMAAPVIKASDSQ